jgi:hypothetical protein
VHGYIAGEHKFCPYEHSKQDIERYGNSPRDLAEKVAGVPVKQINLGS